MSLIKSLPNLSKIKNSMPSVKMPSVKMPSVKMPSVKMPSMPSTVDVKSDNVLIYFYKNVIKNLLIIVIFMLLIFCMYLVVKVFGINLETDKENEVNEEKIYILQRFKKVKIPKEKSEEKSEEKSRRKYRKHK